MILEGKEIEKGKAEIMQKAGFAMAWRLFLFSIIIAIPLVFGFITSGIDIDNVEPILIIIGAAVITIAIYFIIAKLFLLSSLTKPTKHYFLKLLCSKLAFNRYIYLWIGVNLGLAFFVAVILSFVPPEIDLNFMAAPVAMTGCMVGNYRVLNSLLKRGDATIQLNNMNNKVV